MRPEQTYEFVGTAAKVKCKQYSNSGRRQNRQIDQNLAAFAYVQRPDQSLLYVGIFADGMKVFATTEVRFVGS